MPAYFTSAALSEYNSKFSSTNILDLEGKVIVITNWTLELRKVNSQEVFTSYGGLECRLIVHSFKPQLKDSTHPTRMPLNLYRDDEFKTTVQQFRHAQVVAAAAKSGAGAPAIGSGKGNVSQGLLTNSCGEWSFKEGNTKTVSLGGARKKSAGDAKVLVKGGKKILKKVVKGKGNALAALGSKASKGKKSASGKRSAGEQRSASKPHSTSAMTVKQYQNFLKKAGKKAAKK